MIDFVSATRSTQDEFWRSSALGASLLRLSNDTRLAAAHIAYENRRGLPAVYNERILADGGSDILVFLHDDLWLDDYFIADRLLAAMQVYDVVGVAGNQRRSPGQVGWILAGNGMTLADPAQLSGTIAHGPHPFGKLATFGSTPADCELLDGIFLAARKSVLRERGVLFDERFDFHFYDLDFCRSARARGLRLGTWPICLTHQSEAAYGTPAWNAAKDLYLQKWGD